MTERSNGPRRTAERDLSELFSHIRKGLRKGAIDPIAVREGLGTVLVGLLLDRQEGFRETYASFFFHTAWMDSLKPWVRRLNELTEECRTAIRVMWVNTGALVYLEKHHKREAREVLNLGHTPRSRFPPAKPPEETRPPREPPERDHTAPGPPEEDYMDGASHTLMRLDAVLTAYVSIRTRFNTEIKELNNIAENVWKWIVPGAERAVPISDVPDALLALEALMRAHLIKELMHDGLSVWRSLKLPSLDRLRIEIDKALNTAEEYLNRIAKFANGKWTLEPLKAEIAISFFFAKSFSGERVDSEFRELALFFRESKYEIVSNAYRRVMTTIHVPIKVGESIEPAWQIEENFFAALELACYVYAVEAGLRDRDNNVPLKLAKRFGVTKSANIIKLTERLLLQCSDGGRLVALLNELVEDVIPKEPKRRPRR